MASEKSSAAVVSPVASTSLLEPRQTFRPFDYPEAYDFWFTQMSCYWLPQSVEMASTKEDWAHNLTDSEKKLVEGVLNGFTLAEVYVGNYWGQLVTHWFPKPEIHMMAFAFAAWEQLHAKSYSHLSDTLSLEEHNVFLQEPTAAAKLEYLASAHQGSELKDIARSLAIYSGFMEGVCLFSSFAVLFSFAQRKLLSGVGEIVSYSIRDESVHSAAGCWLFNQLLKENPQLRNSELENSIVEAARTVVELEDNFIDRIFDSELEINGLTARALKEFIRQRTNTKLSDLGYEPIYDVDSKLTRTITGWFDAAVAGQVDTDFFANRETNYSRGSFDVNSINLDEMDLDF